MTQDIWLETCKECGNIINLRTPHYGFYLNKEEREKDAVDGEIILLHDTKLMKVLCSECGKAYNKQLQVPKLKINKRDTI